MMFRPPVCISLLPCIHINTCCFYVIEINSDIRQLWSFLLPQIHVVKQLMRRFLAWEEIFILGSWIASVPFPSSWFLIIIFQLMRSSFSNIHFHVGATLTIIVSKWFLWTFHQILVLEWRVRFQRQCLRFFYNWLWIMYLMLGLCLPLCLTWW